MTKAELLKKVKSRLGNPPDENDETLEEYIQDAIDYMISAGVAATKLDVKNDNIDNKCIGCIARGVADLWNYGNGDTSFSEYFYQRVGQLRSEPVVVDNG